MSFAFFCLFKIIIFYLFKNFLFIILAALGLRFCAWAFSSEQGLLFVVVQGLLIVMVSLVAEHGL